MPVSIYTGEPSELDRHMKMLDITHSSPSCRSEVETAPFFTQNVRERARLLLGSAPKILTQYGFMGGIIDKATRWNDSAAPERAGGDPRLFYNVATPSSVFICGSQGSGKSHTLSCLLESCLLPSPMVNTLPRPLTGIIFHYDNFSSDAGDGLPCEAASLSSNRNVSDIYRKFPNVYVQALRITQDQLNTERMLDLMAIRTANTDKWPLYVSVVTKILREMRLCQQLNGARGFDYRDFKKRLAAEALTPSQLAPLQQRLASLESFMVGSYTTGSTKGMKGETPFAASATSQHEASSWDPKRGQLTIVDLSCPCISAVTACALFNVCLALFLESRAEIGRVVALDEAHKYMADSESEPFTKSLLSAIRLQRHLAARIFISTQEPAISSRLLELCSATIVHRFDSPAWMSALSRHLAGASSLLRARKGSVSLIGEATDPEGLEIESETISKRYSRRLWLCAQGKLFSSLQRQRCISLSPSTGTSHQRKT